MCPVAVHLGDHAGGNRHQVGQVQEHGAARRQHQKGVAVERGDDREDSAHPDGRSGRAVRGVHLAQRIRERQPTVPRERVHHTRHRCEARQRTQEVRDHDADDDQAAQDARHGRLAQKPIERPPALLGSEGEAIRRDRLRRIGRVRHRHSLRDREHEGANHDVAEQERPPHRADHALRHLARRIARLLGRMRRGIEAGDGVDGMQQAEAKHIDRGRRERGRPDAAARITREVGVGEQPADVVRRGKGQKRQSQHHGGRQDQIAAEIREHRRQPQEVVIEDRLHDGDGEDEDGLIPPACRELARGDPVRHVPAEHFREEQIAEQEEQAHVHRRHHEDEAEQVEPGRCPSPAAPAENRRPVIDAARSGIGRCDLPHGGGHDESEQGPDRPHDADGSTTAGAQGRWEGRDAARHDANDGK